MDRNCDTFKPQYVLVPNSLGSDRVLNHDYIASGPGARVVSKHPRFRS